MLKYKQSYKMKPPLSARVVRGHSFAKDIVGCLSFGEGSGVKVFDSSGGGIAGTIKGTSPSWTTGRYGSALSLPGTDEYVDLGDDKRLELASGTISIWVKFNDTDAFVQLYWKEQSTDDRGGLSINENGIIGLRICKNDVWELEITADIEVGVWYQVVATFGAGGAELFINGISKGKDASTLGFDHIEGGNVLLAARMLASLYPCNCVIDQLMIFNRALLPVEIVKLYHRMFCMYDRRARPGLLVG